MINRMFRSYHRIARSGFTLVEVMLSMVVLSIMLILIAQIIGQTQRTWRTTSARLSQFREARIAFDTMSRNLRQATLNSYRDYYYYGDVKNKLPNSNQPSEYPTGYARRSDLGFICGNAGTLAGSSVGSGTPVGQAVFFQAPLGVTSDSSYQNLKNLLCVRGYFLMWGSNSEYLPEGLAARLTGTYRMRLMEYQPPAENNEIYDINQRSINTVNSEPYWVDVSPDYLRPVTENIVALIISPRLSTGSEQVSFGGQMMSPTSIAPNYTYNSAVVANQNSSNPQGTQHMLPPVVQLTMVALDGASIDRIIETVGSGNASAAAQALNVVGASGASFSSAASFDQDLQTVEQYLNGLKLNYRVFKGAVVIPAASRGVL